MYISCLYYCCVITSAVLSNSYLAIFSYCFCEIVDQRFSFYYPLFSDRKIACDLFYILPKWVRGPPVPLKNFLLTSKSCPSTLMTPFPPMPWSLSASSLTGEVVLCSTSPILSPLSSPMPWATRLLRSAVITLKFLRFGRWTLVSSITSFPTY